MTEDLADLSKDIQVRFVPGEGLENDRRRRLSGGEVDI